MFHLCHEWTCNLDLNIWSLAFSWPQWFGAHGPVRSIETPAVTVKRQALSFAVLEKPESMQAWNIWQQSCHHEEPKKQRVTSWWYHWSPDIAMPEMSISLDFFVTWSNKGLSLLGPVLSWLKGPIQCNTPSTTKTSHPVINTFIPFLDSGLGPCLCPSCQVTRKLIEDSGYSTLGPMSWFLEWGQIAISRRNQPSILLDTQVCLIYLYKHMLHFLHSKAFHVF